MGLVVNEAMAEPALHSGNSCGCAMVVQHGVTGWTFDSHDNYALAELFLMPSEGHLTIERLQRCTSSFRKLFA